MKVLLTILLPLALFAAPQHLEVHHGSASMHEKGSHTLIENSPNAILHWQDFSIAKGESIHFAQEHAKSTVLNRVTSGQTSHLLGKLTSNGAVFLINPSGVLIGADAHIQTAGFLSSTADISNENFLNGHYLFSSPGKGHITNQGKITCPQGDIYLIAKTIQSTGTLQAENVSEVSAYEVLITPNANEKVAIRTELNESEIAALKQDLETTNPYEKAVHHSGSIEAFGTKDENGRIYLIAQQRETIVRGTLLAESGEIQVLGDSVHLTETAQLSASGSEGGTVLIGGDYKGSNPDIMNANWITIENGATVNAEGVAVNGGKVILWGNQGMDFHGDISVQATGDIGDGGFVEVSSLGQYCFAGRVNALSKNGTKGTLLIDPVNLVIGTVSNEAIPGCPTVNYNPSISPTTNILATAVESHLDTCDLIIDNTGAGSGSGNLIFSAPITWGSSSDSNFTCHAGGNVTFNSGVVITNHGTGKFTVNAAQQMTLNSGVRIVNTASNGGVNFPAIELNARKTPSSGATHGIFIAGGMPEISSIDGNITLFGRTSSQNLAYAIGIGMLSSPLPSISINAGGVGHISLHGVTSGANQQKDGIAIWSGNITSKDGNITIIGEVNSPQGAQRINEGIYINGATIQSTGTGSIFFEGISNPGSRCLRLVTLFGDTLTNSGSISINTNKALLNNRSDSIGVVRSRTCSSDSGNITINCSSDRNSALVSGGSISTGEDGTISIDAVCGEPGDLGGIGMSNFGVIQSVNGNIEIRGSGGGASSNSPGILNSSSAAIIRSENGDISLIGNGGFASPGIHVTSGSVNTTGTGNIFCVATGGSQGILLTGGSSNITTASGAISLTGTGGGTAGGGDGIRVISSADVLAGGSGQITLTGTGSLTGGGSSRGIFVTGSGSLVQSSSGDIILNGTGGNGLDGNNGVEVSSGGGITSTYGTIRRTITSLGGTGNANCHGILVNGAGSTITTTNGAVNLEGTGGGSTAPNHGIFVTGGGQISSTGPLFALTGTGNGTGSGNSGINLNNATISQVATDVTLTGIGSPIGLNNNYGIELSNGTGITTESGEINLTANGGGTGQNNHGISFTAPGNITSTGGNITIHATGSSTGTTQCMGLLVDGAGTEITTATGIIDVTGTGGGSGTTNPGIFVRNQGSIHSTSGPIALSGAAASNTLEGITLENQARVFTTGDINVSTFSDLLITDNSSIDAQGNNPAVFNITTDLRILGGAGATTPAFVNLTDGTATFTVGRDLVLQGGTGADSQAQIGNVGLSLSASSPMTFQVGRDVILTGGTSPSQIGHLNTAGSTLGGNIDITCQNDLSVIGGTDPNGFARIGHGGQPNAATYNPSTMQLIAGRDINITSNAGDAQVVNENGPLTLVVDNLFPTFPNVGPGAFNLNSTLTATGELRIYTARQSENTVNDLINGVAFVPGPFDVNTNTEQWRIYFAGGTYGGAAFKFYYKDPIVFPSDPPITPQFFRNVAANLVELPEILPILQHLRAPRVFPNYHFKLCLEEENARECSPNFSPYGSFIFEDDVWWIGESF